MKNIFKYVKAILLAVVATLASVLIFALILKLTDIPNAAINPVNQIIKVLSIFFGAFVLFRSFNSNGLANGAIIGASYTLISFALFSILTSENLFAINFLTDLIFGTIIGAICGIICVNFFKNKTQVA